MDNYKRVKPWRNAENELVLWQVPNKWVWIALAAWLAAQLLEDERVLVPIVYLIFYFAAGYWSYLEITAGDSTFRRWLGIAVAVLLAVSLIMRIN